MKETEQASEPDSDIAGVLELSDQEFKITMINKLRHLTDKVDSMQEWMGNDSRDMKILSRNQKEMSEIKNTVTEMKNAFDGFICRPDMAEERIYQQKLPKWKSKAKEV